MFGAPDPHSSFKGDLLSHLQLVQNATTILLKGARKQDYIRSVLASSHWLPVHFGVDFKIYCLFLRVTKWVSISLPF